MVIIDVLLGARWLGHGRALEASLALTCAIYAGILLIDPDSAAHSSATAVLVWQGVTSWMLSIPFALKAILTATGLYRNIRGLSGSRYFRIAGALTGTFVWAFYLTQYIAYDAVGALGTACCITGIVASIRVIGMAAADLPRPGAVGVV